jgi:hypothetical protein
MGGSAPILARRCRRARHDTRVVRDPGGAATTAIDADQDVATLINVFTVSPGRQQQLVEILEEATDG